MAKKLILLPHLLDKVRTEYYEQHSLPEETIFEFIDRMINPNGRGLLTSKLGEEPVRIKVWGEIFSLTCVEATEKDSIKAVSCSDTKTFQFNYALETGYPLPGPWQILASEEARSAGKTQIAAQDEESLVEQLEAVENVRLKKQEFKEFEAYWNRFDLVNQLMGESLKEQKKQSVAEYEGLKPDYDRNRIVLHLKPGSPTYRTDSRIRICSKQAWNKDYDLHHGNLEKLPSIGIGIIIKHDVNNRRLVIEANNTELLRRAAQDKELQQGRLWIDDVGSRSIISRQRQALKRLFEKKTANPNLKDFLPEVNLLEAGRSVPIQETNLPSEFEILTDGQKEAVRGALAENDLYLIQGPPGTGKTTVISTIVQYLTKSGKRVLLSSQTNLAVDNVLQRIGEKPGVQAIRIGTEENIELDCIQYSLQNRVDNLLDEMKGKLNDRGAELTRLRSETDHLIQVEEAHRYIEGKVNGIVNLLRNIASKSEERNQRSSSVEQLRILHQDITRAALGFEQSDGDLLSVYADLERVRKQQSEPWELISQKAYIAKYLRIDDDDRIDIGMYMDVIDEINLVMEQEELNSKQIEELGFEERQLESKRKATENRIFQSQRQGGMESEIRSAMELYEGYSLELKNVYNLAEGKKRQRKTIENQVRELHDTAIRYKEKIESYIQIHTNIWMHLFNTPKVTKGKFLEILKETDHFIALYGEFTQHWALFDRMHAYTDYLQAVEQRESLKTQLFEAAEGLKELEKTIQVFTTKADVYSQEPLVQQYLEYYSIRMEQLESSKEKERVRAFDQQLMELRKRTDLLEKTAMLASEWNDQLSNYQPCFEDIYIGTSNLVCATCLGISSAQNNYFLESEFDYVIVDEAARSTSLELLIPLTRGKKVVLVGDHKQISPQLDREIVKQLEADNSISEEEMNRLFKQSLFGIMYERADTRLKSFLNMQFRMNEDLSKVVSTYFYDAQLLDHASVKEKRHSLESELENGFYWIDTPYLGAFSEIEDHAKSFFNTNEAELTISILDWLDTQLTVSKSVGVIAPYNAQRHRLLEMMEDKRYVHLNVEINTVDAFQGREKNIVLLSLVRNNPKGIMGHTANYARVNVAISRAQELMLVIGSSEFIRKHRDRAPKWHEVYSHLSSRRSILSGDMFRPERKA